MKLGSTVRVSASFPVGSATRFHRTAVMRWVALACAVSLALSLMCMAYEPALAQGPVPQPPEELPVPQAPEELVAPRAPASKGSLEPAQPPSAGPDVPTTVEPKRPKSKKPIDQLLLQRGAILLPRGWLQVEPSLDVTRFSTDRLAISGVSLFEAIVIGKISADKVTREIVTGAATFRYGLMNRLQLETRIPYVYRHDRELIGVGTANEVERNIENHHIGDVEASLVWQAYLGSDSLPAVLLRVRGRTHTGRDPFTIPVEEVSVGDAQNPATRSGLTDVPTGNGYYSVAPGVTLVWRMDPVVLFAGANYSFNLSRTIDGVGRLNPGDNWEAFLGLNFAVSERLGLNMTFFDSGFSALEVDGAKRKNTAFNSGVLAIGTSIVLSPTQTLLISAGKGLTKESPDFQFTISLPMTFDVFNVFK